MRKAWKCSSCSQMCTRRENLKRHSKRFHNGRSEPLLRYISGNSIFIPESDHSASTYSKVVFTDQHANAKNKKIVQDNFAESTFKNMPRPMSEVFNPNDPVYVPLFKAMEIQSWMNSHHGVYSKNPPARVTQYFAEANNLLAGNREYSRIPIDFLDSLKKSELEVNICPDCLAIILTTKELSYSHVENPHKCKQGMDNALKALGPEGYLVEFSKAENFARSLLGTA